MIEAELPDGTILEFPDGTAPEVMQRVVKQRIGGKAPAQEKSGALQTLGNVLAGGIRGAGSIGATILAPWDIAKDAMAGKGLSLESNRERRAAMDAGLASMGAETDSFGYGAGKLAGEIAGTAGVPGVLAKGAQALKASPALVEALRTSGMSSGGQTGAKALATRVAGGAATGGASAALADPEQISTGAAIGAAIPVAGKVISGTGTLAKKAIGATTGVGDSALTQALRAGKEGGKVAEDFTKAMRGESSMDDVLTMAKQNLEAMGQQKQAAYRQGMSGIKADKTVLDLKNVDQAVNDAIGMATFKGQIKNEKAASALSQIKGEIDNWKSLDPAEFHTPEGLDALKQKIGGILEEIPFEQKTARTAAGKVYDSLRGEISKQAPEYAKVMKGYSEASDTIKEIEKALSLGQKASADTSMRKLQSLMRNNVNTNYGQRADQRKK